MATLSNESIAVNEKTWKPKTAGILNIIAGTVGLIGSPIMIAYGSIAVWKSDYWLYMYYAGLLLIPIGIIAIIGGIFAIKRKIWVIALVGSISAVICFLVLGIPAAIFVTQSKHEF